MRVREERRRNDLCVRLRRAYRVTVTRGVEQFYSFQRSRREIGLF